MNPSEFFAEPPPSGAQCYKVAIVGCDAVVRTSLCALLYGSINSRRDLRNARSQSRVCQGVPLFTP
jgi:hypothetical protein